MPQTDQKAEVTPHVRIYFWVTILIKYLGFYSPCYTTFTFIYYRVPNLNIDPGLIPRRIRISLSLLSFCSCLSGSDQSNQWGSGSDIGLRWDPILDSSFNFVKHVRYTKICYFQKNNWLYQLIRLCELCLNIRYTSSL